MVAISAQIKQHVYIETAPDQSLISLNGMP